MAKKNKKKNIIKSDKTAFTKEEFYGKSRKSRRQRGKNKNKNNVSRETITGEVRDNKIILTIEEQVELMLKQFPAE